MEIYKTSGNDVVIPQDDYSVIQAKIAGLENDLKVKQEAIVKLTQSYEVNELAKQILLSSIYVADHDTYTRHIYNIEMCFSIAEEFIKYCKERS